MTIPGQRVDEPQPVTTTSDVGPNRQGLAPRCGAGWRRRVSEHDAALDVAEAAVRSVKGAKPPLEPRGTRRMRRDAHAVGFVSDQASRLMVFSIQSEKAGTLL
jgi:hypothetical protein